MNARSAPLAVLTVLALSACGPKAATGPTWNQDVAPLVSVRCANCHVAGGIAPFALTSYAEAKPHAQAMAAAVKAKLMPPWPAAPADAHFLNDWSLTDAQIDTITKWAEGGAPEGDAKATPAAAPVKVGLPMKRTDLTISMPTAYKPQLRPDDYRCFPIKWTKDTPVYITGFNARPGVPKQAHHIAVYAVPPEQADLPFQWDAQEDGPGYTCFGGPFGSHDQSFPVNLLTAWIPGGQGETYPRGFGIEVQPGTTLVVQMHYNTQDVDPQDDLTSLDFQLEDSVQKRAAYTPFLNFSWPLGNMEVPPNAHTVQTFEADPRDSFHTLGSTLNTDNGFNIEAVMFHMHKLGTEGTLWLEKPDKSRVKILEIPAWNFHWQLEYVLDQPVRFEPGDQLRVTCTFDNVPDRWTDGQVKDVNWGEGSNDEMCVANLLSTE
jgi:hypothetical protein